MYGGTDIAPAVLNLGTRWKGYVSFTPRPLYVGQRATGTDFVGLRAGLDAVLFLSCHLLYRICKNTSYVCSERAQDRVLT